MIITIDGPAGTGKTTIAKTIAKKLGFFYFDTGAMYRAVTYFFLKKNFSFTDKESIKESLSKFQFSIRPINNETRYFVGDEDVTEEIRSQEVTKYVSEVSALKEVREFLVAIQHHFSERGDCVFEGRDMGTVVFPNAEWKIYLVARPEVRAERRYLEIKNKIPQATQEDILQEIIARDHYDSTREISPLRQASGATLIDTSDLTIEEVTNKIFTMVTNR